MISYPNQYNIQAAGKDDHINENQLNDMVVAGGTRNDLEWPKNGFILVIILVLVYK